MVGQSSIIYEERRRRRSPWASEALRFQLQEVARLYRQDAVVLADSRGQLWAASERAGAGELALSAAGLGPLADAEGFCWVQRGGTPMLCKTLQVDGTTLYLAARGPGYSSRSALTHAASGVQRILAGL